MTRKQEIIDNFTLASRDLVSDAEQLVQDLIDSGKGPVLQVNVDATHSGRLTNGRVYPGVHMRRSVDTFLKPTPKPVLKNHNSDSDPVGRVSKAKFVKIKDGSAFREDYLNPGDDLGSGFIQLDLNIMDEDAIAKFLDGRFREFSTRQGFDTLNCSICGNNFAQDYCGHHPGSFYELDEGDAKKSNSKTAKKYLCYAITGALDYREVSIVNIPGDKHTGINSLELVGTDSLNYTEDFIVTCDSENEHGIGSITLTNGDGEEVNLISAPGHSSVTAKDRKRLTGKVIVAASPLFKDTILNNEGETMATKATAAADKTEDATAETQETEITVESTTSDEDGKPTQDSQTPEPKEGVVAPDAKKTDETGKANDDLDPATLKASLTALAATNRTLEAELEGKASEIERLKGSIATKDEELTRAQASAADSLKETKTALAKQLIDTKLILGKSEVSIVTDSASYTEMLEEYIERSTSSLRDSLSDLTPDLTSFKATNGIATVDSMIAGDPVENPVDNKVVIDEKETEESPKPQTRDQLLDSHLS
jgi:hypothetical protein